MKTVIAAFATLGVIAFGAHTAEASSITFGQIVVTTTLVNSGINVDVSAGPGANVGLFGDNGNNRAFGFDVVDPDTSVTIADLTPGFSYAGAGATSLGGGLGDFDFVIDGPHSASGATLPLGFRVTRTDGFGSDLDLYEPNALGYMFGAHVHSFSGDQTSGFVGASLDPTNASIPAAITPEPTSLLLLGTGLAVIARGLRKKDDATSMTAAVLSSNPSR